MKRNVALICVCALLALVACLAFLSRDGRRQATQATKSERVVAPDGTIVDLRNDFTFVAEVPKSTENASPATTPAGKK
jgi:hypothetical protein